MVMTDLQLGQKALIKDLASVSHLIRRRLLDLGIMEGVEITLKQKLPFGGPLTIEAGGQWVGLRQAEAKCIRLEIKS